MAARITLCKGLTAAAGPSASIRVRLADPPFRFVATGGFTGSVAIEESMDAPPDPQGFTSGATGGVPDASATWQSVPLIAGLQSGDSQEWRNPLFRIRVNPANMTGGSANIYLIEGIRSLKSGKTGKLRMKSRQTQTEKT